jgi:hypothetical protein
MPWQKEADLREERHQLMVHGSTAAPFAYAPRPVGDLTNQAVRLTRDYLRL